jgi:hypothetical protein
MKKLRIKLNIQHHEDRQNIITALANSGISVKVEEETYLARTTYYVIFDYEVEEQ